MGTNSLSKKTKQELIDIILRKDDVHQKLNEEINKIKQLNNSKIKKIDSLELEIEQFKDLCDDNTEHIMCLKRKVKEYKWCSVIASILFLLMIILYVW